MSLSYVTLVLDAYDGQGNIVTKGSASFVPSVQLTDPGAEWIPPAPIPGVFRAGSVPSVKLLATDNDGPQPEDWTWGVTFDGVPGSPAGFSFELPYSGGPTQYLSALVPVESGTDFQAYMPLPGGTPGAGQVPSATGHGQVSAWSTLPANAADASAMLVPGYQYPNPPTFWDELIAAGPAPVRYIVANVSSGPGSSADPNYTAVIDAAVAAGITVLGYVDTDFAAVDPSTVAANVGLWASLYGVTSVFFDRASSDSGDEPYYATACALVSGVRVLNHGALPDEGYANIADVLVVYEDVQSNWAAFSPPSWFAAYPASRFAVLVYDAVGASVMASVVTQAQQYGIGNVYVTDQTGGDPYAVEPSYFAAEIAQALVPLSGYLSLTGGTMSGPLNMGSQKITSPGGYDPVTAGFTCFATGGAPQDLNLTSGTSSSMTSGEWFYAALMVPYDCTLTGLIFTCSVASGTDKWVCALFGPSGAAVANSATAGATTPGSAGKFRIAFTAPVAVAGPCVYYAGVQSNGTTAKFLSFSLTVEGFVTGSASGSFGTIPTLSLATAYTQNVGPYATTY